MSGLDQMLRLQKFALDEKRRQAADLDALIERLRGDVRRLDEDVAREIETARGKIDLERALPEYRKVMAERRERILKSITDLSAELDKLRDQIMESFSELKKTEQTIANRQQRQRNAQRRRDQIRADEVGLELHRRKKNTTL
jgi:flagellar FliJ protein